MYVPANGGRPSCRVTQGTVSGPTEAQAVTRPCPHTWRLCPGHSQVKPGGYGRGGAEATASSPPHFPLGVGGQDELGLACPPSPEGPSPMSSPRPTAGGPGAHGHVFVGSDEVPWELKLISFGVSLDPRGAAMRLRPGAGVTGCPGCAVILETNLKHVSFTVEAKTPVVCRLLERTQRAPGPAGASAPAGERAAPGCTPTGSASVSRAAGSHGRLGRQGTREGRPEGSVSPQARRPAHPRG